MIKLLKGSVIKKAVKAAVSLKARAAQKAKGVQTQTETQIASHTALTDSAVQQQRAVNTLERTPARDTFTAASPVENISASAKAEKAAQAENALTEAQQTSQTRPSNNESKRMTAATQHQTLIDFEYIKKEKLFNEEIMFVLQPKTTASGAKIFTPNQTKVINLAVKKATFYKGMSKRLEALGSSTIEKIIKDVKTVFGGEKNYGKYLHARSKNGQPSSKDSVSIYNKIIKEFKDKKVNTEIMNIFSRKLYQKPYKMLDKTEKELVKLSIFDGDVKLESRDYKAFEKILSTGKKDYEEAVDWIKDLIGLRMIIPDSADMNVAAQYLTEAILGGKFNVTRVSNYHANHIYPYISQDTVKLWKQSVPGIEVVQSNAIRKQNGYTTTQMNILHPVKDKSGKIKYVWVELQLRSEALNKIGQIEHLIYDILAKKNIGKDIPELQKYYDSIGIEKAVHEVFGNPQKEAAYIDYERAMYSWIRHNENPASRQSCTRPILTDFGLGEYEHLLSFEALQQIDDTAKILKERYGKADLKKLTKK